MSNLYICIFNLQDSPKEAEKFVTNALSNLKTTMNVMEPVQNTDLIVEAVVENINVKQKLFSSIDPVRFLFVLCV
jgi:3-hydroxyacyl-CoA dehydrogenase